MKQAAASAPTQAAQAAARATTAPSAASSAMPFVTATGATAMAYGLTPEAQQQIKVHFDASKMLGNKAYGEKNFDDALKHYNYSLQIDPQNTTGQLHTIYSNISAVFASRLDWDKSYHYAWQAVYVRPQFAKGHSRMATALFALRRYADAKSRTRRAYSSSLPTSTHESSSISATSTSQA